MSLLLQALARINSQNTPPAALVGDDEELAPSIVAGPIELPVANLASERGIKSPIDPISGPSNNAVKPAVGEEEMGLESFASLAAELDAAVPTCAEEVRPSLRIISNEWALPKRLDLDSTLDGLSEFCQAIDADIAQRAATIPVAAASERPASESPPLVAQPKVDESPRMKPPVVLPQVVLVKSPPAVEVPAVRLREEFRILKESIAMRLPLADHKTLMIVDAGPTPIDASWLWAFAAAVVSEFANRPIASPDLTARQSSAIDTPPDAAKVLIVDAAGRESGLAAALGFEDGIGLTDVIGGSASVQSAIQETFHPQIRFLPRGDHRLDPNLALALKGVWATLSHDFDIVLIAAGAFCAGPHDKTALSQRDAELLLPFADGVVMAVELDGTPIDYCREAKRRLDEIGANLLGCVVRGELAA